MSVAEERLREEKEAKLPLTKEEKEARIQQYYNEKFIGNFTRKELETLRATIAAGTNDAEFALFIQTCVNTGLNPFLNQIHPVVYEGKGGRKMSIQVSVEGILALARKQPGYKGIDVQLVHENDQFSVKRVDGKMEIQHSFSFPRGQVVGGYAIARKEGFEDVVVVMEAQEVEHMKSGRNGHMWTTWFNDMFKKHLVKRAAKEQYGIEIAEEEPVETSGVTSLRDYREQKERRVIQISETEEVDEKQLLEQKWKEAYEKAAEYGLDQQEVAELIKSKFGGKAHDEFTPQNVVALIKFIELLGNEKKKVQEKKAKKQEDKKQAEVIEVEVEEVQQQEEQQEEKREPEQVEFNLDDPEQLEAFFEMQ
jgi:recombination protein RecT